MNITITEIMSSKLYQQIYQSKIIKFVQKTIGFQSLGYNDYLTTEVYLEGFKEPFMVKLSEPMTTRKLNQLFKGKLLSKVNGK